MVTRPSVRPVFVLGSGRSGTTLLLRLLNGHSDFSWISRLTDRVPHLPQLSALSRSPALRRFRLFQASTDSINAYAHCGLTSAALREKGGSLTEEDFTESSALCLRRMVDLHARWMGRPRFVNKATANTMRIRLMNAIFPDACFVHIVRNGYAVANSLVRVKWWPDADIWWKRTTPREWEAQGGDPIELAAGNWFRQVSEILENKVSIPEERFVECRYEDLLTDTDHVMRRILRVCDLEWTDEFARHVNQTQVTARNKDKWRDQLGTEDKQTVTRIAGSLLKELDYEVLS